MIDTPVVGCKRCLSYGGTKHLRKKLRRCPHNQNNATITGTTNFISIQTTNAVVAPAPPPITQEEDQQADVVTIDPLIRRNHT